MKTNVAEGLQNCVLLVNAAIFEELVKAGIMDTANIGVADKEKIVAIVKEITGSDVVAVLFALLVIVLLKWNSLKKEAT